MTGSNMASVWPRPISTSSLVLRCVSLRFWVSYGAAVLTSRTVSSFTGEAPSTLPEPCPPAPDPSVSALLSSASDPTFALRVRLCPSQPVFQSSERPKSPLQPQRPPAQQSPLSPAAPAENGASQPGQVQPRLHIQREALDWGDTVVSTSNRCRPSAPLLPGTGWPGQIPGRLG